MSSGSITSNRWRESPGAPPCVLMSVPCIVDMPSPPLPPPQYKHEGRLSQKLLFFLLVLPEPLLPPNSLAGGQRPAWPAVEAGGDVVWRRCPAVIRSARRGASETERTVRVATRTAVRHYGPRGLSSLSTWPKFQNGGYIRI